MKKKFKILALVLMALMSFNVSNAQTQNYLSASGNKLFDASGEEVRLTGINWFGFETSVFFPHGIWTRDMKSVLQQIKDLGFNTIRVPWCNEMLDPGVTISVPSYGVDSYSGVSPMNEEETNVSTPIELLDIFVDWCQENDMKIVLDNHSRSADGFLIEGLWYTDEYSEERWINDWIFMAERYSGKSAVVAMDLNNEPHDSSWGDSTPATDWNKAAERCGNAILEVNPDVLIIVEGVGEFEGNSYWWGGNLMGAEQYPVVLSDPSKLMYSAHEYGPEVSPQDWFEAPNFPNNMPEIWNDNYDYLYQNNTSPIFVGEFGIKFEDAFNGIAFTWFTEFMDFMGGRYSWTFWTMNPNSGDTGGILQEDWVSINQWKMDVLAPYFSDFIPNVIDGDVTPIPNTAPVASFIGFNEPCGENPKIAFLDASNSSDADGDSLTYTWSYANDTIGTGEEITYDFSDIAEDIVSITLTVSDGELSDSITQDVGLFIGACPPPTILQLIIDASPTSGTAPLTTNLSATVIMEDGSNGDNVELQWSFNNEIFSTENSTSRTFTEEGEYTIILTGIAEGGTVTENVTITVTEEIIITPVDSDLSINYRNGGNSAIDNAINPHFEIVNDGDSAISYEDLSVRYWFTGEDNNDFTFWCDWAQLGTANVTGSFGQSNGTDYLEVTFAAGAGNLLANSTSGNIQTRFAKTNWSNFDESDDYSYDPDKTAYTSHEQITLYQNGVLVWGIEPGAAKSIGNYLSLMSFYPNPTSDFITIKSSNLSNGSLKIYDLSGKLLKQEKTNVGSDSFTIQVSDLNPGAYFVEFVNQEMKQTKVFIVK